MRDSNVANAAKESTQREFSHGLRSFCTIGLSRQHRRQALRELSKLNSDNCCYAGRFSIRRMVDLRIDRQLKQLLNAGPGGDRERHRHRANALFARKESILVDGANKNSRKR